MPEVPRAGEAKAPAAAAAAAAAQAGKAEDACIYRNSPEFLQSDTRIVEAEYLQGREDEEEEEEGIGPPAAARKRSLHHCSRPSNTHQPMQ